MRREMGGLAIMTGGKKYMRKSKKHHKGMKPGQGGRFEKLEEKLEGQGKSEKSAKAIAAAAGRKKYGKKKFAKMAHKKHRGMY